MFYRLSIVSIGPVPSPGASLPAPTTASGAVGRHDHRGQKTLTPAAGGALVQPLAANPLPRPPVCPRAAARRRPPPRPPPHRGASSGEEGAAAQSRRYRAEMNPGIASGAQRDKRLTQVTGGGGRRSP